MPQNITSQTLWWKNSIPVQDTAYFWQYNLAWFRRVEKDTNSGLNDIFAEFESHWLGNEVEGDTYLPAEAAFFQDVVAGVVRDQASNVRPYDSTRDQAVADLAALNAPIKDTAFGVFRM